LDEVIDGKRTGKRLTIKLMVQLHGHLMAFDALSGFNDCIKRLCKPNGNKH
jgi:hypothetical protein